MRRMILRGTLLAAALLGVTAICPAQAPQPIDVPLTAAHWRISDDPLSPGKPDVQFFRHEGFPQGVLSIKSGNAALNGLTFRNGTIEYDFKALAPDLPGIQFRQQGAPGRQSAEEFYVRTFPDCQASDDCIQYAPVIHGFMLWNSYPQHQTHAFILDGWNHVKLVVSGRRMNVYINRLAAPALTVGDLESDSDAGGLQFRGPALFANLVVTPDAVERLPPQSAPDPTASDRGLVRQWKLGPQTPLHFGKTPDFAEMPRDPATWKSINAGRFGMVNLDREFSFTATPPALTWLQSSVQSDRDQDKQVSLGWLGQVWIFVNGRLVTQGKNFYDPEPERRDPDGRLSLENGSFTIPLRQGTNVIVIAMFASVHDNARTPNRYGWGLEMRYADPRGLRLTR